MNLEVIPEKNKEIFFKLEKFEEFYLAGGTALALQISHRISIDFDFFNSKEITKNLLSKVKRVFKENKVLISVNNSDELTIFIDDIKITFLKYPFSPVFNFVECNNINLLSVKEIAASKAYTIGRRDSYKDYIDIYYIIAEKYSNLDEIIGIAEKKYKNEFNSRLFLEQLIYLKDIKKEKIIFLKDEIDTKKLENFFKKEIRKIDI